MQFQMTIYSLVHAFSYICSFSINFFLISPIFSFTKQMIFDIVYFTSGHQGIIL